MELRQAHKIAAGLVEQLSDSTSKIYIAGSIRREKEDCRDIELVALPKLIPAYYDKNLFSDATTVEAILIRSPKFINTVRGFGKILKGKVDDGKYVQIELPEEINLDLFIPSEDDFWRQLCIRTGSAEFVKRYIAGGWKRKLYCGSDVGLRKIKDCEEVISPTTGKSSWRCTNPDAEKVEWDSEHHFFHWLGLKWLEPKDRNI